MWVNVWELLMAVKSKVILWEHLMVDLLVDPMDNLKVL